MSDEKNNSATWAIAGILLVALLLAIGGVLWYANDRAEQQGRNCAQQVLYEGGSTDDC